MIDNVDKAEIFFWFLPPKRIIAADFHFSFWMQKELVTNGSVE